MEEDRIAGLNAVGALFARRPESVRRLFYAPGMKAQAGPFCAALARLRRPYRMLDEAELARAAATTHHGGIVAVAARRHLPVLDTANPPRLRLLLLLDRVGNPHNLGAIARSAAFFGVGAIVLHDVPGTAMPSDAAYRTAEGGLDYLQLYRTGDLQRTIRALEPHYRTVAATLGEEAAPLAALPRDRAIALVLGNEEHGVSPAVTDACRRQVRVTGAGPVQSLNVAQAAAVLLAALNGQ